MSRKQWFGQTDFWISFALCFCLLICRSYQRLLYPGIWAEDGSVFLPSVLESGAASLLQSWEGYFHTVQKICLLFVVRLFPIKTWAFSMIAIWIFLYAFFAATITLPEYRWLIPNQKTRHATALLLCVVPGLTEMLGNYANLNWVLIFWMAIWALKDPALPFSKVQIGACFLVLLSTGTFVLLLPMFVWRVWYVRHFLKSSRRTIGEWVIITGILVGIVTLSILFILNAHRSNLSFFGAVNPKTSAPQVEEVISEIVTLGPLAFVKHLFRVWLFRPWIGSRYASKISDALPSDWFGLTAGTVILIWLMRRFWTKRSSGPLQAVMALVFGISLWPCLNWIARSGTIPLFVHWGSGKISVWGCRYSFPLSLASTIFWPVALSVYSPTLLKRKWLTVTGLYVILNVSHAKTFFRIPPYAGYPPVANELWKNTYPMLQSAIRTGYPVTVPISPTGWKMVYHASKGTLHRNPSKNKPPQ